MVMRETLNPRLKNFHHFECAATDVQTRNAVRFVNDIIQTTGSVDKVEISYCKYKLNFMHNLRSELPNANYLVTFESAARHLNFTHAASELNVSRVAVSQQIRTLESHLGVLLFDRLPKSLKLTIAGAQYKIAVSEALSNLQKATREIRAPQRTNSVKVTSSAAISTFWLMPRLGAFREKHPGIDIRIIVADSYLDLGSEDIDVAIRHGDKRNWPDLKCIRMFGDTVIPVCSDGYFGKRDALTDPKELLGEQLIQLEGYYHGNYMWNHWFTEQHVEVENVPGSLHVDSYVNLVQAALDGQGIALVSQSLVQQYLNKSQLLVPCVAPAIVQDESLTFYIATSKSRKTSESAEAFCDWLETFSEH